MVLEEIAMVEDTPQDLVHDIAADVVFAEPSAGAGPWIGRADVIAAREPTAPWAPTTARRLPSRLERRAGGGRQHRARAAGPRLLAGAAL